MTLLVVGINHHSAPIEVLEAVAAIDMAQALQHVRSSDVVAEAMMLSTCNRVEAYTSVGKFHPAVGAVSEALAKAAGMPVDRLSEYLYVHYEDAAVRHAFRVAGGLDSMVVGDEQILGQFRDALKGAQEEGSAGRTLNDLAQNALRVGKRVQSTTGIARHGASVVGVALAAAERELGSLAGRRVVVVGTGSMSAIAATEAASAGAEVVVIGRTTSHAQRVAENVGGRTADWQYLAAQTAEADVLVSATGATGVLIGSQHIGQRSKPLVVCDLAMPHDTDPSIADLPFVTRLDIAAVADLPGAEVANEAVATAEAIVMEETVGFSARQTSARVEPIVAALRAHADEVLDSELQRLRLRLNDLSDGDFDEVTRALRRTVATLLHTPTVRMKQFAGEAGGDRYAQALHALFDLDPRAVSALTDLEEPGV